MTRIAFHKTLSANDVGATGAHQGGILIPKGERELLAMLPPLDPQIKNPDVWLTCIDQHGDILKFRFVYYNNKLHDPHGTRNEYRITYMTTWFRNQGARQGDMFEISREEGHDGYFVKVISATTSVEQAEEQGPVRIQLRGWQRVH